MRFGTAVTDELRTLIGNAVPLRERIHVTVVTDADGEPLDDDASPGNAARWNDLRWNHARSAIRQAGSTPAVFLLAGGRRRTITAMQVVTFQLLARERDRLVDVRVSDRRVEGALAGFYFPEQTRQELRTDEGIVIARDVRVNLVNVVVPRLRPVLSESALRTYGDALVVGQRTLDALPPLELRVDGATRSVTLDGVPIELTETLFVWYAVLAIARRENMDDGWVASAALDLPLRVLRSLKLRGADWAPASKAWEIVLVGCAPAVMRHRRGLFSILRSKTKSVVEAHCRHAKLDPSVSRWIIPERETASGSGGVRQTRWRISLDPSHIDVVGL